MTTAKITGIPHPMPIVKLDTGYTKICPLCAHRFGNRGSLIGRTRTLDFVRCRPCEIAGPSEWNKAYRGVK